MSPPLLAGSSEPYPLDSFHFPPPFLSRLSPLSLSPSFPVSGCRLQMAPPPSSSLSPPSILGPPPPTHSIPSSASPAPFSSSPALSSPSPGSLNPSPPPASSSSWSSRLKASLRTLRKINSARPSTRKFHTHIPDQVLSEGSSFLHNCILVQFYGRAPPLAKIKHLANLLWGKLSSIRIHRFNNGDLVFQLKSKEARDLILQKPLWYLGNLPVFLSEWKPGYKPSKPSLIRTPLWVIFRDVPLELFTHTGLSYIASIIGDPLYLDKSTENLLRLDQAKICIEVNILEPLPDVVTLSFDDDSETEIQVEYPWKPPICEACEDIGHPASLCPLSKRDGKQKASQKETSSPEPSDPSPSTPVVSQGLGTPLDSQSLLQPVSSSIPTPAPPIVQPLSSVVSSQVSNQLPQLPLQNQPSASTSTPRLMPALPLLK